MIDLLGLESPELLWYQMSVRAILVFILAFAFIRIAGMRSFGSNSAFDIVLNITIGAILGRAIAGHYPFFSCLLTAAILAICHRFTAILVFKFKRLKSLVEGEPVCLYKDGKLNPVALMKNSINDDDINRALHEQNIDSFVNVSSIWYETDGKISVVKKIL